MYAKFEVSSIDMAHPVHHILKNIYLKSLIDGSLTE